MNARQKRLFEEARKRNPEFKVPEDNQPALDWTEEDLGLIKQGVGDKSGKVGRQAPEGTGESGEGAERTGSIVTYFGEKGFGFLRPDDGGRDVFFHVSKVVDGSALDLKPGMRVVYELGMDRTGKMAASSVRIAEQLA